MKLFERIRLVAHHKKPFKLLFAYFLRKLNISKYFTIDKGFYRMRFYPTALLMHYWADNYCRDEELFILSKLVKFNSNIIDVGANVGTISLPISVIVGPRGMVFSIEAHPKIFSYLKMNVELNKHLSNIKCFNYAVSNRSGTIEFSNYSSDDMNKIILGRKSNSFVKVNMKKLDEIIDESYNISNIRLLKIDVEGYELFVLEGAQKILEKTEIVYFESAEEHFNYYGYKTSDIIKFLLERNFYVFKFENYDFIKLDEKYMSHKPENLLAFRNLKDIQCLIE